MIINGMSSQAWFQAAKGHGLRIVIGMRGGRTRARERGTDKLRGELYYSKEGALHTWLDTGGGEIDTSKIDTEKER